MLLLLYWCTSVRKDKLLLSSHLSIYSISTVVFGYLFICLFTFFSTYFLRDYVAQHTTTRFIDNKQAKTHVNTSKAEAKKNCKLNVILDFVKICSVTV